MPKKTNFSQPIRPIKQLEINQNFIAGIVY